MKERGLFWLKFLESEFQVWADVMVWSLMRAAITALMQKRDQMITQQAEMNYAQLGFDDEPLMRTAF